MTEFNWTPDELQKIVEENSIVLFMKGTPDAPQCGFSNRAASVVSQLRVPFASVNVLSRSQSKERSQRLVWIPHNASVIHRWEIDWRFGYCS